MAGGLLQEVLHRWDLDIGDRSIGEGEDFTSWECNTVELPDVFIEELLGSDRRTQRTDSVPISVHCRTSEGRCLVHNFKEICHNVSYLFARFGNLNIFFQKETHCRHLCIEI